MFILRYDVESALFKLCAKWVLLAKVPAKLVMYASELEWASGYQNMHEDRIRRDASDLSVRMYAYTGMHNFTPRLEIY